jgi:tetratricopeptide (TPR) repeat protein
MAERALEVTRGVHASERPLVAGALNDLAATYISLGRYAEAEPLLREALEIHREHLGPEHDVIATNLANIGAVLTKMERYEEAESWFREGLGMERKIKGSDHPEVAHKLHNFAVCLVELGRLDEAEAHLREALAIRMAKTPEHWLTQETRSVLGAVLGARGRSAEAESLLEDSAARIAQARGSHDEYAVRALGRAALYFEEAGDERRARTYRERMAAAATEGSPGRAAGATR